MRFKIVGAGPQTHVKFELKVATAIAALEALADARRVCPGVAVFDENGKLIDNAELAQLVELEKAALVSEPNPKG